MKLIVVSICKNEESTIGQVLDGVPKKIDGIGKIEKWVIDDGSSDNTTAVAKKHGANVISDGASKRLAYRFREALELAIQLKADVLVNIDGDLQFNPKDIPQLVEPIVQDKADFVAADRFTDSQTGQKRRPKGMPVGKYYGNKMGAWVVGKLSKNYFRDVTCGFRAYNRKAIVSLNINSTYTYTQESFQVLAMKKMRILPIPVTVKYYTGRKSRVVKSFWQFVFGSAINILRAYRDYAPLRFFGSLGFIFFIPGLLAGIFTTGHFLMTGVFSPYKAVGFAAIYLMSIGFIVWIIGLLADMFDRMLNNQEKILESIKEAKYEKK